MSGSASSGVSGGGGSAWWGIGIDPSGLWADDDSEDVGAVLVG